ncbi:MAG: hypothetical protein OK438_06835 [Thaumarchaeota archaeon]|nr:hypothetical protein [Nitrososphaerota archaeon]
MTEFFDAVKSPVTKRKYELRIRQFLGWVYGDKAPTAPARKGVKLDPRTENASKATTRKLASDFVLRAKREPDWATGAINDFLREVKARVEAGEISASTVSIYTKPLKLFCVMNDIPVNWAKLSRKMPKGLHAADDRPPTLDEVRKILQYPDRRIKPIVLTMLSSGIRIGSWDHIRWGHIEKIERGGELLAARVKAYNTKAGRWYKTFITPEAFRSVEEYIEYRQGMGEPMTKDSPVVRDLLDTDRGGSGKALKPVPLSARIVKRIVERAISSAGLRGKLPAGQRRHEFKATHGFRKYFDTAAERHMKTLHVEQLLDHDTGLKESYNRPTEDDLLNDYLKAVPELTISQEGELRNELEKNIAVSDRTVAELERDNVALQDRLGKIEKNYEELRKMIIDRGQPAKRREKPKKLERG